MAALVAFPCLHVNTWAAFQKDLHHGRRFAKALFSGFQKLHWTSILQEMWTTLLTSCVLRDEHKIQPPLQLLLSLSSSLKHPPTKSETCCQCTFEKKPKTSVSFGFCLILKCSLCSRRKKCGIKKKSVPLFAAKCPQWESSPAIRNTGSPVSHALWVAC